MFVCNCISSFVRHGGRAESRSALQLDQSCQTAADTWGAPGGTNGKLGQAEMSKVFTLLLASSEELDIELEQGEERRLRMVI